MTTTIERPILFNGAMVRAILDGRKTQTRRVVKNLEGRPANSWTLHRAVGCADSWSSDSGWMGRCPYGQPGDRLWVRETWAKFHNAFLYRSDDVNPPPLKWKPSIHMPREGEKPAS